MKFFNYLKDVINANTDSSSKRFCGVCCILFSMLVCLVDMCIKPYGQIHDSVLYAICEFLTIGCILLGITIFEDKFKNILDKNNK